MTGLETLSVAFMDLNGSYVSSRAALLSALGTSKDVKDEHDEDDLLIIPLEHSISRCVELLRFKTEKHTVQKQHSEGVTVCVMSSTVWMMRSSGPS